MLTKAFLLLVAFVSLCLPGCGSEQEMEGTWIFDLAQSKLIHKELLPPTRDLSITFSGGRFKLGHLGAGTWTKDGNHVFLHPDEGREILMVIQYGPKAAEVGKQIEMDLNQDGKLLTWPLYHESTSSFVPIVGFVKIPND